MLIAAEDPAEVSNLAPVPVCLKPWRENPYRLVSLKEMIETIADEIVSLWPKLMNLYLGFDMTGESKTTLEEARETLGDASSLCRRMKWTDLGNQSARLLNAIQEGRDKVALDALAKDLQSAFDEKFQGLHVVLIEEQDSELFKNASAYLCGTLHTDLSISEEELNLAGRALAFGLSTASVSHAMRSAEASLHALSHKLGITFPATSVELQDWMVLTEKISAEISRLEKLPRSPKKTEELKWLAGLILPANAFRLAWRNHVAHAREKYEGEEARKALRHVGDYLKTLSGGL